MKNFLFSAALAAVSLLGMPRDGNTADLSPQNTNAPEPPNAPIDSKTRDAVVDSVKARISGDQNLSPEAKRIQLSMNQEGKVEMRGKVRSSEERAKVENLAARVVGSGKILNMLQIENISQGIDGQTP